VSALDATLVLCADHELNVSTFAARVAASAGADLYLSMAAGLAAASGPRHGGACDRVEALVQEAARPDRAEPVVLARSRRGEELPGFGHTLYPGGDPRAVPLLAWAKELAPRGVGVRTLLALVEAMQKTRGERPSVETGVVAVALALGLPAGSAAGLFSLGRCAGWVAHILEQRESGKLLRPRARYVGAVSPGA
jgi:citrate synthase